MSVPSTLHEENLSVAPIQSLGLAIAGTALEAILTEFGVELQRAGIRRLQPRFYLSTEWGVPFGTVAIAIPFYLASPELTRLHVERSGHVEGNGPADILRDPRHEMGHVVNYAYRLYEQPAWIEHFGSIEAPYEEDYRPQAFDPRFVDNLPGWYAQKHPDEDWAETFAVWMTPGQDWRKQYARKPMALAKLIYCDRTMGELADREPLVTAADLDEDVAELAYSLDQFYSDPASAPTPLALDFDQGLRQIFEDQEASAAGPQHSAAALIRRLECELQAEVYRWTGHFPERTRLLLRHLATRANDLDLVYTPARESAVMVALTVFVSALAMNFVRHGTYMP